MEIPYSELKEDTLIHIIESFVLREGTDYGHNDINLEQKVSAVKAQLESGKAIIVYNPDDQSLSIVVRKA
jgi:uncharacterized protein